MISRVHTKWRYSLFSLFHVSHMTETSLCESVEIMAGFSSLNSGI